MSWCPPAATGIAVGAGLLYTIAGGYAAHRVGCNTDGNYFAMLVILVGAPFFPLYEAFGKVSRLESESSAVKKELEKEIPVFITFLEKNQDALHLY